MSLATTTYIRCRLHRNDGGTDQSLEIRMGRLRRLISRRPFDGIPYKIRTESSLFPLGNATLPLPLQKLQDPLFCHSYITSFLSHFKFSAVASDQIARNITSSVVELLTAGNYDAKFCLVAEINHIRLFWPENEESRNSENPASKRLKKEEFEDGDCSVCLQELKDEVCRIECGHAYHKSCLLNWFKRTNSCPLCRRKILKIVKIYTLKAHFYV